MVEDIAKRQQKARNRFLLELPRVLAKITWSEDMLCEVNRECNFDQGYYHVLFPGGVPEIVLAYEDWQNQRMLELLEKGEKFKKIRQIIANALEVRIMQIVSKEAALNQSGYFLMPTNLPQGIECAAKTCDIIWRFAGDQSTDFNYYTKRGLLLPIYLSAQTYYFADESEGYKKTKEFIDSSLDSIINIFSLVNRCKPPRMQDIPILRLFS
jgi:ubiquinone biosynthesis protein COQ9